MHKFTVFLTIILASVFFTTSQATAEGKATKEECVSKSKEAAKLIEKVKPDVLVKGADYKISEIVGAEFVKNNGGRVRRLKLTRGRSTTGMIKRIKARK